MNTPDQYQEPFKRIDVDEAKRLIDSGEATVIDVREPWEHAQGFVPTAKLVPLAKILSNPRESITTDNVIFHCEVGQRSAVAAEIAASLGLKNLYNLEGGMAAWRAKGLPVEK